MPYFYFSSNCVFVLAAYLTARGYCSRRINKTQYIVLVFPARYGPYILHHVLADKPYQYLQDLHVSGIRAIVLILSYPGLQIMHVVRSFGVLMHVVRSFGVLSMEDKIHAVQCV